MIPLVLIPGLMCDARMWGLVPDLIPLRTLHHALPSDHDSIPALAAAILADAPPRFALAGLSMGGILAMEMLHQAPDRVERIALMDTNPLAEVPDTRARRGPQIARALAGDLAGVMRDEMKPNYLARADDTATLDLCLAMALRLGPDRFRAHSCALRDRADRTDALRAFTGPALVLMGEQDRLCPRDRHDLMHSLMPQSRLVIVPGAGHLPPLENPAATAAALTDWLKD
jgi:pimeloyl-ACP methyl ester carboxylesterase